MFVGTYPYARHRRLESPFLWDETGVFPSRSGDRAKACGGIQGAGCRNATEALAENALLHLREANAVIQIAENLPSTDAPTREAWRRQAQTAVAALKAHEQMMVQITRTIAAAVGADKTAMEPLLAAAASIMDEFMKTWGPQLHAMQDLVANWTSQKKN